MDLPAFLASGARVLRRRPGYATLVIATLAVGIGGATAIFSLVQGVLLRALPYAEADRLVTPDVRSNQGYLISLSIPNYEDWRDRNRSFDAFGASAGWAFARGTPEGAERVDARVVLGDFFGLLGLEAEVGRVIPAESTGPGAEPVVVLGHGFWQRAFGGDPGVLGSALVLDEQPYTIVGVLPAGAGYPRPDVEIYTPMGFLSGSLPWDDRGSSFGTRALARLAPGVTLRSAQEDMNRITAEVDAEEGRPGVTAEMRTLADILVGDVRRGLWLLMGSVVLVLLIAGANVANLALARAEARSTEMAVRRALGAGSSDITSVVLAESLVLSAVGGGAGVTLAAWVIGVLPSILPLQLPALMAGGVGLNVPVVAFAIGLTVAAGLGFSLAPALKGSLGGGSLGHGARASGGRLGRRLRDGLVVAQVALSFVLLASSGLLLESLDALRGVDKGFDEEGVYTARISQPRGAFDGAEPWLAFYDALLEEVSAAPDVTTTAAALLVPLSDRSWEREVLPDNVPFDREQAQSVLYNVVSEDYFEAMGMPLLRGRAFHPADVDGAPLVAVIDETMAERFWPGEDPVGKQITLMEIRSEDDTDVLWRTVVGVVPNLRHYELASPSRVQAYVPMRQALGATGTSLNLIAKARGDAAALPALTRQAVARLRPDIPIASSRMMSSYVADALGEGRALGATTTLFGVIAALLAALGIFGILSLAVARRAREMGLRMAVGASPGSVVSLVVRRGLALALAGAVLGVGASLLTGRILKAVLFEVGPWDPGVFGAVLLLLSAAAVAASLQPALRAARTAPATVLRDD